MGVVTYQSGDPLSSLLPLSEIEVGIPLVIYTRVSSDDAGEERSCDEQESEVQSDVSAYIQRMREPLEIVATLRDPNVSASRYAPKKDRPHWLKLLEMMRAGQVKVVAFWEMSRATRRLTEWAEFADIAEDQRIHVFLRGRMYDCANPADMAYLTNQVIRGIEEVGQARERVQRSVRSQAEKGRPGSGPCFGLRSVYDDRTGALITHEPDYGPWPRPDGEWTPAGLVVDAVERVLSGESRWSICSEWNELGIPSPRGKEWGGMTLTSILRSTSIAGMRTHKGVLIEEGGWVGLISFEDFKELQRVLDSVPAAGGQRNRDAGLKYFCSGWMQCGVCGRRMKPGKAGRSRVLRCPPFPGGVYGCVSRNISNLEDHVEALVVAEMSRPDVMLRFEKQVDKAQVRRDKKRLEKLRSESRIAFEKSLESGPGRLSVAELMSIRASLSREMEQIQERLDAVEQPVPKQIRYLVEAGPGLVLERWRALAAEQKRSLLREVTDSGHVLPTGRVGRRKLLPSESVDIRFKGDPPFVLLG